MPDNPYGEYSDQRLKFAYWFTKNKVLIKAIFLSLGFLAAGLLLFFNLKSLIDYFVHDELGTLQEQITSAPGVWQSVDRARYQPQDLIFGPVQIIPKSDQSIDLLVKVTNPNNKWYVSELNYHFFLQGWQSVSRNDYVLPNQSKWLIYLNLSTVDFNFQDLRELEPRLVVDSVSRSRVRDTTHYDSLGNFIMPDLRAVNVKYQSLADNLFDFSFDLVNDSIYNFKEVDAKVFLYNGASLIGINAVTVPEVLSNSVQPVLLRWFKNFPPITNWEVVFFTNLLEPENFLPYRLEQFK